MIPFLTSGPASLRVTLRTAVATSASVKDSDRTSTMPVRTIAIRSALPGLTLKATTTTEGQERLISPARAMVSFRQACVNQRQQPCATQ